MVEPIGIVNKNVENTLLHFARLAIGDAKHDFAGKNIPGSFGRLKFETDILPNVEAYLPTQVDKRKINVSQLDEDILMIDTIGKDNVRVMRETMNKTQSYEIQRRTYEVHTKNNSDIATAEQVRDFLKGITQSEHHALVVDTCNKSFRKAIHESNTRFDNILYVVNNREIQADPGSILPSTFENDDTKGTGFTVEVLNERDDSTIYYTSFSETTKDVKNDFFSNLNIELRKGKSEPIMVINDLKNNYIKQVHKPSFANSISSCIKELKLFLFKKSASKQQQIVLIQKRSGDWLQALSSLQDRVYNKNVDNVPFILLTIDRALVAYALSIGAHVLYFANEKVGKTVFYYNKNNAKVDRVILTPIERVKNEIYKNKDILQDAYKFHLDLMDAYVLYEYRMDSAIARLYENMRQKGLTNESAIEYFRTCVELCAIRGSLFNKNKINMSIEDVTSFQTLETLRAYENESNLYVLKMILDRYEFALNQYPTSSNLANEYIFNLISVKKPIIDKKFKLKLFSFDAIDMYAFAPLITFLYERLPDKVNAFIELMTQTRHKEFKRVINIIISKFNNVEQTAGGDYDDIQEQLQLVFKNILSSTKSQQTEDDSYFKNNYVIVEDEDDGTKFEMFMNVYDYGLTILRILFPLLNDAFQTSILNEYYEVVRKDILLKIQEHPYWDSQVFDILTRENVANAMNLSDITKIPEDVTAGLDIINEPTTPETVVGEALSIPSPGITMNPPDVKRGLFLGDATKDLLRESQNEILTDDEKDEVSGRPEFPAPIITTQEEKPYRFDYDEDDDEFFAETPTMAPKSIKMSPVKEKTPSHSGTNLAHIFNSLRKGSQTTSVRRRTVRKTMTPTAKAITERNLKRKREQESSHRNVTFRH